VDGFWSISVYNEEEFFEPNDWDAYSVNNITATPNDDCSITLELPRPPVPTEARGQERCVGVPRGSLTEREARR
jgi:hypothetical protein